MSLINDTLKNLDNNQQNSVSHGGSNGFTPPPPKSPRFNANKWRLVTVVVLIIVLAILVLIAFWPKHEKTSAQNPTKKSSLHTQFDQLITKNFIKTNSFHKANHLNNDVKKGYENAKTAPIEISSANKKARQKEMVYQEAMKTFQQGDSQKAINELSQLLQKYPHYQQARLALAAILMQEKQNQQALKVLQVGLYQVPNDPDYIKMIAYILIQQGNTNAAFTLLQEAQPDNVAHHKDYFGLLGALYLKRQQYNNAQQVYQRLTEADPNNWRWWLGLGTALDNLGQHNQAQNAFKRARQEGLPASLRHATQGNL